jgi:hypothetical protein
MCNFTKSTPLPLIINEMSLQLDAISDAKLSLLPHESRGGIDPFSDDYEFTAEIHTWHRVAAIKSPEQIQAEIERRNKAIERLNERLKNAVVSPIHPEQPPFAPWWRIEYECGEVVWTPKNDRAVGDLIIKVSVSYTKIAGPSPRNAWAHWVGFFHYRMRPRSAPKTEPPAQTRQ